MYISLKPFGKMIFVSDVQPSNAVSLIVVSPSGKLMCFSDVQFQNACSWMLVRPSITRVFVLSLPYGPIQNITFPLSGNSKANI